MRSYKVRHAAQLLGVTDEGIRKRVRNGDLKANDNGGTLSVDADQVDLERADLLTSLDAIDALLHPDFGNVQSRIKELEVALDKVTRELRIARSANAPLLLAARSALDAVAQFVIPADLAGVDGEVP